MLSVNWSTQEIRVPVLEDSDYGHLKWYAERGFLVMGQYSGLLNPGMKHHRQVKALRLSNEESAVES